MTEEKNKIVPLQSLFRSNMSDRDALVLFLKGFHHTSQQAERKVDTYYEALEKQKDRMEAELPGLYLPMPTWAMIWSETGSPASVVIDKQNRVHVVIDPMLLLEKPAHLTPQELAAVAEHEWGHVVDKYRLQSSKTDLQKECFADHTVKYMSDIENPLDKNFIRALQKFNAVAGTDSTKHLAHQPRIANLRDKMHSDSPPHTLAFEDDCSSGLINFPIVPRPKPTHQK